jgi:hypothetical protein
MPEQYYRTVEVPNANVDNSFRFKIMGNTGATLAIGGRRIKLHVRETSGRGFTLGTKKRNAKKLKSGKRGDLYYDGRRYLVQTEQTLGEVGDEARFFVGVIREYEPKESWAFRLPFTRGRKIISHESAANSGAVYGGFVLFLFCALALPGLGDRLGTAPRIESALRILSNNVTDVWNAVRK